MQLGCFASPYLNYATEEMSGSMKDVLKWTNFLKGHHIIMYRNQHTVCHGQLIIICFFFKIFGKNIQIWTKMLVLYLAQKKQSI